MSHQSDDGHGSPAGGNDSRPTPGCIPTTIQGVMEAFPGLACYWFVPRFSRGKCRDEEKFACDQAELLGADQEIELSRQWLRDHCIQRATINQDLGSYGLKHSAEDSLGRYIANGVFIVAAILEGYRIQREAGGSPNCCFNMKILTNKKI